MKTDKSPFDPQHDLLPLVYSSRFLDTFGFALLLRDEQGVIIDSNRAAQELLNFSSANLKGQTPFDSRWNPCATTARPSLCQNSPAWRRSKPATDQRRAYRD